MDDLNALIAHAHRRIDQLNQELAEQRVREQIHTDAALEQQKLEHQKALEKAVKTALQHVKEETRLEQERKVVDRRCRKDLTLLCNVQIGSLMPGRLAWAGTNYRLISYL